jgi:hypothetical protein
MVLTNISGQIQMQGGQVRGGHTFAADPSVSCLLKRPFKETEIHSEEEVFCLTVLSFLWAFLSHQPTQFHLLNFVINLKTTLITIESKLCCVF